MDSLDSLEVISHHFTMFFSGKTTKTHECFGGVNRHLPAIFFETGKQADSDHILDEIALGTQQFCNALQFFCCDQ